MLSDESNVFLAQVFEKDFAVMTVVLVCPEVVLTVAEIVTDLGDMRKANELVHTLLPIGSDPRLSR